MKILLDILFLVFFYLLIIVVDYMLYLRHVFPLWQTVIHKIMNGRMVPMRLNLVHPVYILLIIGLWYFPKNVYEAMLLGLIVYGVFDFTIMTLFADIPLSYGIIDIIWGTLFMGFLFTIKEFFNEN